MLRKEKKVVEFDVFCVEKKGKWLLSLVLFVVLRKEEVVEFDITEK